MSEHKKLHNLIGKLNIKIKKLETNCSDKNNILSHYIHLSSNTSSKTKYIGMMFSPCLNYMDDDDKTKTNSDKLIPFIKLQKSSMIINYSIYFELDNYKSIHINKSTNQINQINQNNQINSIALGIKSNSKIKIIKGSKIFFEFTDKNPTVISNTILYSGEYGDELCIIGNLNIPYTIISKKSIIKIMCV